ncbi:MAG: hypothetical protein Q4C58_07270 [Eubacteriales bacterium]|nr:hypothetical protein [Eubacteriales bacterium]
MEKYSFRHQGDQGQRGQNVSSGAVTASSQFNQRDVLLRRKKEVSKMIKGLDAAQEKNMADYRYALRSCSAQWKELRCCQPEYKKQNLVLEAYYQRGKLMDYLEEVVKYAYADVRPADTAEKLAVKGYSNYLFVLKSLFDGLREKYDAFEEPGEQEDKTPIQSFLMNECRSNPFYDEWFALTDRIRELLEKGKIRPLSAQECAPVFGELDVTEYTLRRDHEKLTVYLREKQRAIRNRIVKMKQESERGKALYEALLQVLTPELFDKMDPDTLEAEQMSIEQIRDQYRALADRINETILLRFPRA